MAVGDRDTAGDRDRLQHWSSTSPPTVSTCLRSSSSKAPSRHIRVRSSWSPRIAGNLGSGHGIAVGYVELVADKLKQDGKQIGHDGQSYTVTRLGAGSVDEVVSAVEVLAHGQIDLSGLVTSTPSGPGTFRLAVTAGTGNYQDARGYATVVPGNTPTVTIQLTP